MAIRRAKAITLRPTGVVDAIDGTNAPLGSMAVLTDLIPNPTTRGQFVPRPASIQATAFPGFTTPAFVTSLLVLGNIAWGTISTGRYANHDEPFCYNIATNTFITIANVTSANTPISPATTGDWSPPCIASITNGRIVITHPGYDGINYFIGWIDVSSFSSTTVTGTTHSSTLIDALSSNVITVNGWQVGYAISGAGIPANTYIKSIAANGLSIVLTNAATSGGAGVALTVTGGTPSAPLYGAGQVSGQYPLVAVPTWVALFSGRAYYAVGNAVVLSDALLPTQITGAGGTFVPVLTLGDSTPVNCLAGLPLTSQVTGGTIQSLIAFKGDESFFQITGDPSAGTPALTQSAVPNSVGTLAPNTLCGTPEGLAFIAPDGLRLLTEAGTLTQPIGQHGDGVNIPFLSAINPTRMTMAYNQNVLRVSVQNGFANGEPFQEYWFDMGLKIWTGPHSFPANQISAYQGASQGFISVAIASPAALWSSTAVPTITSTYTENGAAMSWVWQPTLFPDNDEMSANQVVESAMAFAIAAAQNMSILAMDESGNQLDLINLVGSGGATVEWGNFNWGAQPWGMAALAFQQYQLLWDQPLVFKQMSLRITGASLAGTILGNLYVRAAPTGYLLSMRAPYIPPPSPPSPPSPFTLDTSLLDGPNVLT